MTAVILSGGLSSRMNRNNKAFLEMDGESLIEIAIKKVSLFHETLIVTNSPADYSHLGVRTVTDIIPQCGPLSGIHSGLIHSNCHHCFVIPCDMPFLSSEAIAYIAAQAEGYDVAVPKLNGRYQPLCGVYSKSCLVLIETCLKNNIHKIVQLYPMVRVREIDEQEIRKFGQPEELFRNINNPEEYDRFCRHTAIKN